MQKLLFLVPNIDRARTVVDTLQRNGGVGRQNLSLLAHVTTPLDDLPAADLTERSDFYPALQRGIAVGGAIGLIGGVVAMTIPVAGFAVGGAALLGSTAMGATFGAWVSSLVGTSVPNSRLREFESAVEKGQVLLLVDVEADDVERVQSLVRDAHPRVEFHGVQDALAPVI